MQPIRCLERTLRSIASPQHYLFSLAGLSTILPGRDRNAITQIASRAIAAGFLTRACQGIYLLADTPRTGHELFHIAATLRAGFFNYISQETVLSEAGIVSQITVSRVTIMTSGRSAHITRGNFGTIEFTHTKRNLAGLSSRLDYDGQRRMLCAPADIAWLRQNPANTSPVALGAKLAEHQSDVPTFATRCAERTTLIETPQFRALFKLELERFLPDRVLPTIQNPEFLTYITRSIHEDLERFLYSTSIHSDNAWEL